MNYWNNNPDVLAYICENITGDKQKWWVQDFKERYCQQPLDCALSLNCGNGWVERDFIDQGIARRIIGFDFSYDLLHEAESKRNGRNISYFQTDVNQIDFLPDQFDLIINVAALHHVQYINRLSLILAKSLKKDGLFVSWDYIGPERNQYPLKMWFLIKRFNRILPPELRREKVFYPHLSTMLISDPTEAIHSDLIVETAKRYFDFLEYHEAGGGIAYEILTNNPNIAKVPSEALKPHLEKILLADKKYTAEGKVPSLFAYFVARPNKSSLNDINSNEHFQNCENEREKLALRREGVYHFYQFLLLKIQRVVARLWRAWHRFRRF